MKNCGYIFRWPVGTELGAKLFQSLTQATEYACLNPVVGRIDELVARDDAQAIINDLDAELRVTRQALKSLKGEREDLLDAPAKPSATAETVTAIIRDICEHEPDDNPDSAHISIKALELILLQNLEGLQQTATQPQGEPVAQKYDDTLLPFLTLMRRELHANAGKGDRPGWLSMSSDTCLLEIIYHFGKLQASVKRGDGDGMAEYGADVANLCMMLLDICGVINLARNVEQPAPVAVEWGYCPECGSEEIRHQEGGHKQCADCHQEWFSDIDYTDVVRGHLKKMASVVAPVAVVLPERHNDTGSLDGYGSPWDDGWNDCLDEVARLNGVKP